MNMLFIGGEMRRSAKTTCLTVTDEALHVRGFWTKVAFPSRIHVVTMAPGLSLYSSSRFAEHMAEPRLFHIVR